MLTNTTEYDKLFAGHFPVITETGTLATGQNLPRGAVVGLILLTGLLTLCDSTAVDGSEVPYGILAKDVDATAADTPCTVYLTGEFNRSELSFGGTDTYETHKVTLRNVSIFGKEVKS